MNLRTRRTWGTSERRRVATTTAAGGVGPAGARGREQPAASAPAPSSLPSQPAPPPVVVRRSLRALPATPRPQPLSPLPPTPAALEPHAPSRARTHDRPAAPTHAPTASPMQYEIEREVENLRDLRRRSTAQGAVIDPDLPEHTAPTVEPWTASASAAAIADPGAAYPDSVDEDAILAPPAGDPSNNLFWLPARLHPEIAPSEFRAFLKEHSREGVAGSLSRANSGSSMASTGLGRKRSMLHKEYDPSKGGPNDSDDIKPLRRNRSRMYQDAPALTISDLQKLEELAEEASLTDDPTKLRSVLRRSLSMNVSPSVIDQMDDIPMGDEADSPIVARPQGPGTIVRRAARTKIRRANQAAGAAHAFKSKRAGRGAGADEDPTLHRRDSSDMSASDHGEVASAVPKAVRRPSLAHSNESFSIESYSDETSSMGMHRPVSLDQQDRPMSYSEETSIYDSYVRGDDEDDQLVTSPTKDESPFDFGALMTPVPDTTLHEPVTHDTELHHPQPQRLAPPQPESPQVSRSPSPDAPSIASSLDNMQLHQPHHPPAIQQPSSQPPPVQAPYKSPPGSLRKEKEKDKKGLFKWGKKDKEKDKKEKEKEKEKDSGLFGSLFGGGKKKQEEPAQPIGGGSGAHQSGREAAAALLGASKSRQFTPSPGPQMQGTGGIGGAYARYPIHVERAIYRLSHIKLANPRRPLYEQVLISNLMFWYLGVINKAQSQPQTPAAAPTAQGQQAQQLGQPGSRDLSDAAAPQPSNQQALAASAEREAREKEARERDARAKAEREAAEREQKEQQRREPRRGTLTKAPPAGTPANRRAEMPVRGPQYERQHQAMENEYGGPGPGAYGSGSAAQQQPPGRSTSTPPMQPTAGYRPNAAPPRSPHSGPPALVQPPSGGGGSGNFYYDPAAEQRRPQSAGLPPGAMAPANVGSDQSWSAAAQPQPQPRTRTHSSPNAHQGQNGAGGYSGSRGSNSPPQQAGGGGRYANAAPESWQFVPGGGGNKTPGRSLSATAMAAQQQGMPNGGKGAPAGGVPSRSVSAHARPGSAGSNGSHRQMRSSESGEEDVPLAMWQQQQQRRAGQPF